MTQLNDLGELLAIRAHLSADTSLPQAAVVAVLGACVDDYLIPYRPVAYQDIALALRAPMKAPDGKQNTLAGPRLSDAPSTSRPQGQTAWKGKPPAPAVKGKA